MSGIDQVLRRAADEARRTAHASIDLDEQLAATLERARANFEPAHATDHSSWRLRRWAIGGAAALLVGLLVGAVALTRGDDDGRLPSAPPDERPVAASSTTPANAPDTIAAPPTTAPPPETTGPPPTGAIDQTAPSPVSPGGAVSHRAPPPPLTLQPLGTVELTAPDGVHRWVDVAIGDSGVVVNQSWAGYVTVIGFDGVGRDVPVDGSLAAVVYGPGDVVYGLREGASIEDFAMVAVALAGDRAGTTVASTPLPISTYMELPPAAFGHGADGIVDRARVVNATVAGYVDVNGAPVAWEEEPEPVLLTAAEDGSISASSGQSWQLAIDASPDPASPYVGPSPPAPSSNGLAVYWTHIGANARADEDFGEPTMWVLALLLVDGTVEWLSLPDGWEVVASDVWGTVLGRLNGSQLDLALAGFSAEPRDPADSLDPSWPGDIVVHVESGVVEAPGLNDFIDLEQPGWAASAEEFGKLFAGTLDPENDLVIDVAGDLIDVVVENLLDDSAFASRTIVTTQRGDDGLLRFVSAESSWQCRPGRGHQDFSREDCT